MKFLFFLIAAVVVSLVSGTSRSPFYGGEDNSALQNRAFMSSSASEPTLQGKAKKGSTIYEVFSLVFSANNSAPESSSGPMYLSSQKLNVCRLTGDTSAPTWSSDTLTGATPVWSEKINLTSVNSTHYMLDDLVWNTTGCTGPVDPKLSTFGVVQPFGYGDRVRYLLTERPALPPPAQQKAVDGLARVIYASPKDCMKNDPSDALQFAYISANTCLPGPVRSFYYNVSISAGNPASFAVDVFSGVDCTGVPSSSGTAVEPSCQTLSCYSANACGYENYFYYDMNKSGKGKAGPKVATNLRV